MIIPIETFRIIPLKNSLVVSDLLSFILITTPSKISLQRKLQVRKTRAILAVLSYTSIS